MNKTYRLIKCILALLLICTLSCIESYAQNVSFSFKNTSIKTILTDVSEKTGYDFVYSDALSVINDKATFNMTSDKTNIDAILKELFNNKNVSWKIIGKQVVITPTSIVPKKQDKDESISGSIAIKDSDETIPGAAIRNVRTGEIVISDDSGNFKIKANQGDLLHITSIGMKDFSYIVNRTDKIAKIELEVDMISLEDVVVTGYQDIQKEKVTGSISTISSKKIEERYTPNILTNLEGKVAGLTTYGGKTTIRGTSSLYAETNPLLVVDGLPIEGKIEDLNPYDIESINVLKDAAATAIYGARASNGIIVITTKNAKKEDRIDIDFSANFTIWEKKNVDYSDNFYMNAEQQVKVESDYWEYYFFNNNGDIADPVGSTEGSIRSGVGSISPINYAYYQLAKGQISRADLNDLLARLSKNNYAKEYADAIYKREFLQQYNLAVRSRLNKFQSNFTLNYKHNNDGIINAGNSLLNLNYKGSYDIAKWLTASISINSIYGKTKSAGYDCTSSHTNIWAAPAYESLYNEDGTDKKYYYYHSGHPWWSGNDEEGVHNLGVIAKDEFYNNTQTSKRLHMRYHGDLQFKIIKGLTANAQFIYEDEHVTTDWYATEESHASKSLRNAYTKKDANGKITYLTPRTGGFLQSTATHGAYYTARGQINYSNTFGKHSVSAIAGIEFRETTNNGRKALILGHSDQLQNSSTNTVDFGALSLMQYSPWYMNQEYFALQVYDAYLRNGTGIIVEQHHRYASGYVNMTYTFDDRYNVFGSFRKDYADVYGLNAKFRGKPLWSVGAAWNISNEQFMKEVDWVDFLKLRVSYGVTGNIYQGATSYMTATSTGMNDLTNLPFGEIESPANPNLKWEQSRTANIGVDFGFLNNRFRGSVDIYNKKIKDIFSNKNLDPFTGFTSMFVNTASMTNRGIELQLSADWFRGKGIGDFEWSTSLVFSHNKNKITSVENDATSASQLISNPYKEGYPSSALWSYQYMGRRDSDGAALWLSDKNSPETTVISDSPDILEYSGQTEPVNVIGFDNRFSYKGLSLSILMAYYGGHKMRALTEMQTYGVPYSTLASYFLNGWTPDNPTDSPGIGQYSTTANLDEALNANTAVHDADFLKIRNIVIGYDLPSRWMHAIGFNKATITFQIDNPKALWVANDINVDPETLGLRRPASFIFGVNINL